VNPVFDRKTTRYGVYKLPQNLRQNTRYCDLYPKTLDFLTHNASYRTQWDLKLNKYLTFYGFAVG
jgi:hypothetical protein